MRRFFFIGFASRVVHFGLVAFALSAALILFLSSTGPSVCAQEIPAEAYGPYNAIVLPDGVGLIKPLAPPPSLDPRYQSAQPPDALIEGNAQWTASFWFHSSEPFSRTVLLAGLGDPAGDDARFIGVEDNHLGLWLGNGQGTVHLLSGTVALSPGEWHFAGMAPLRAHGR
jgi:hypothetical protein